MRALNRLLTLLLALALIAGGLLAVAEVAAWLLDRGPLLVPAGRWAARLRAARLDDRAVRAGLAVAGVAALALLVAEAWPWPRRRVPLAREGPVAWWLHRRSAERHLARELARATPAAGVRARLRAVAGTWYLRVRAAAAPRARADLEGWLRSAVGRLGGPTGGRLRLRLRLRGGGGAAP